MSTTPMPVMTPAAPLGFVDGLRSVPAAARMLVRRPKLVLWLVPPLLVTLLLDAAAFYFIFGWLRGVIRGVVADHGFSEGLANGLNLFGGLAVVLALGWTFAWLFLAISSPFQDFISAAVERERNGGAPQAPARITDFVSGTARNVAQAAVLLLLTIPVLVLGFTPVLGPVLVFFWSAFVMGFSFITIPLRRLRERIALVRRHRGAVIGLGAVIALVAVVPLVNLLFLPVFVVAGTLLYLQAGYSVTDIK